jgi:hypothetical protein
VDGIKVISPVLPAFWSEHHHGKEVRQMGQNQDQESLPEVLGRRGDEKEGKKDSRQVHQVRQDDQRQGQGPQGLPEVREEKVISLLLVHD